MATLLKASEQREKMRTNICCEPHRKVAEEEASKNGRARKISRNERAMSEGHLNWSLRHILNFSGPQFPHL